MGEWFYWGRGLADKRLCGVPTHFQAERGPCGVSPGEWRTGDNTWYLLAKVRRYGGEIATEYLAYLFTQERTRKRRHGKAWGRWAEWGGG